MATVVNSCHFTNWPQSPNLFDAKNSYLHPHTDLPDIVYSTALLFTWKVHKNIWANIKYMVIAKNTVTDLRKFNNMEMGNIYGSIGYTLFQLILKFVFWITTSRTRIFFRMKWKRTWVSKHKDTQHNICSILSGISKSYTNCQREQTFRYHPQVGHTVLLGIVVITRVYFERTCVIATVSERQMTKCSATWLSCPITKRCVKVKKIINFLYFIIKAIHFWINTSKLFLEVHD